MWFPGGCPANVWRCVPICIARNGKRRRWFCVTGDEVQPDKNDRFVLLGRADGIVKVAGKRVDLLDVQSKIQSLPTVRDAVVIALPAEKGREKLIAALVACDLTERQIKR